MSLGLLCILILVRLRLLPTQMVQQLAQVMQGDWLQRSIAVVGFARVGWLAFQVWRRRASFTEALRPVHQPLAPTDTAALERESWTRDLWLPMAWLGACEKRGSNVIHEPLAPGTDTAAGPEIPDPAVLPPDEILDREWALNVLR